MGTDPDPNKIRSILHSDGAVVESDSRRPQIPDSFEMQGGVQWVLFQEIKVFVGDSLDEFRQARKRGPKASGAACSSGALA
jgi:hypothetical protein